MNYELSEKILREIKKAKRILLNCHRSPDPDGVGSALALYQVLISLGKKVKVIGPNPLLSDTNFLPHSDKVEIINFSNFDFKNYDLFILLDSADWDMVSGSKDILQPNIPSIIIDHHETNTKFANINLIDSKASSVSEIIYQIFQDWNQLLNKEIAECLLAGIIGDTGVFEFSNVSIKTMEIAKKLMELGADKDKIVFNVYRSMPFNKIKFWGEIIQKMQIDKQRKFVWSAIPYEVYQSYENPKSAKETSATLFAPIIEGTDFGMVMVEEEKGMLSISFRSRTKFDVSKIALKLGGGGHREAAGTRVYDDFENAVEKVLDAARKIADES